MRSNDGIKIEQMEQDKQDAHNMADNSAPLVSIIIPTYNAAHFLPEAVDSIRQQSFLPPLEIIIVDDGSTDNTAALVPQLGADVRYFYQENRGPAAARNRGIAAARGEIIGFLDADDLYTPDKFQIQVTRLLDDPSIDIVQGRIKYVRLKGAVEREIRLDENDSVTFFLIGGALFRKSVFDQIGLFDEELRFSEDHDFFLKIRDHNIPLTLTRHITLHYRLHSGNMTNHKTITDFQLLGVLKKSIDRRRRLHDGAVPEMPLFRDFQEND